MIAAMRPSHAHSTAPSVHSRPSSRNSSHTNSSTIASPSTQSKTDKLAAKVSSNVANGVSGKKASAAKKAVKSQRQTASADTSNPSEKPTPIPGLITLTKPMTEEMQSSKQPSGSSKGKKSKEAKFAADEASSTPIKTSRSKKSKSSPKVDASEMLLSKSAPSATLSHVQQPAQNKHTGNGAEQASGLTWQQEMFKNASNSNLDLSQHGSGSKRHNKKSNPQGATTKHDGNLAHPQKVVQDGRDSPALTWQQELLGAKKRTGPHFDVFADARDVETFGAEDGSAHGHSQANGKAGKRRPRAGSFGSGAVQKNGKGPGKGRGNDLPLHIDDLFESAKGDGMVKSKSAQSQRNAGAAGSAAHLPTQYPPHGAPIHIAPSTPVKKANNSANQQHPAVAAIAYAGPNFHNSPSPASLPAPKFQNRLSKNSSELEQGSLRPSSLAAGSSGESGGSDDDEGEQLTRDVRGATAPAELTATPSKAPTPAALPSRNTAAAESPAPKPGMQPGATVESLLARMLGGARLN
ncbi:hypothetical protein EX895_005541 [Sporisorium graminicola]|uniref:Uncharacterized protein n=1 Tax=Sporisorium graminicola TaxID=280036 RepID=A0A4V6ETI7_9BASI|nr:hypothetical protein EX895_005541 [Sporisorium graminicola]TKY85379.1 hypothetical protein EX895_005541 [Sporisorium graminicola]